MADSTPILDAPTIDTHTHTYLPRYAQAMRDRAAIRDLPYVLPAQGGDVGNGEEALFILPGEDEEGGGGGRPIDASVRLNMKKRRCGGRLTGRLASAVHDSGGQTGLHGQVGHRHLRGLDGVRWAGGGSREAPHGGIAAKV